MKWDSGAADLGCRNTDVIAEYLNKLKSILARRGSDWGIHVPSGNHTTEQLNTFGQHIVDHIANASEIWRTPYGTRGDRLFHITGTEVVVTHLDGTFESTWRRALAGTIGPLSHRGEDHMIGTLPTVGCLIFVQMSDPQAAMQRVLLALETLATVERQKDQQWSVRATLAGEQAEGLLFAQPGHEGRSTAVFVEFDEEAAVLLTKRSGKPLDLLLLPLAVACQGMPEAAAIGIGFEMSVPNNFGSSSLENAGIAVFFVRNKSRKNKSHGVWDRQNIFQLTGHTEQLLTYA